MKVRNGIIYEDAELEVETSQYKAEMLDSFDDLNILSTEPGSL